jgi:hypothetical protein
LYKERSHRYYFGLPPNPGLCQSNKSFGIASITNFVFTAPGWSDSTGIRSYNFYFSFDDGNIFIPLTKKIASNLTLEYIFRAVYKDTWVKIKCEVENQVGFKNILYTQIYLTKRSTSNPQEDLNNMDLSAMTSEADCL